MGGRVVHGVAGQRERYQSVASILTASSSPLAVAEILQSTTGCQALYVADLDAIRRTGDHNAILRTLANRLTAKLWVDAAIADLSAARQLLDLGSVRVIVGSETLPSLAALREMQAALTAEQLLLSLDVGDEGVISRCQALRGVSPLHALELLADERLTEVLLLTLNHVGTGSGPDWSLLQSVRTAFPKLSLIVGGGVRTLDDLRRLADLGVKGALLATSLHRGWISRDDLRALRDPA